MAGYTIYDTIYDIVRHVPAGRVTTYGAIAAAVGSKTGARVVGYAMNASFTVQPPVPAHRVVNRNGLLTGKHHFATPRMMQKLLENEGVTIENDKVADFKALFWNPVTELEM